MKNAAYKFSVIIPVYNVEPYIRRCVDSVLAQSFRDFEIVLVDDGSPDNCGKICDEYAARDERIKCVHQPNDGLSAARNMGLRASRGEYILFLDSDDMWNDAEALQQINRVLVSKPETQVLCFGYKLFNSDGSMRKACIPDNLADGRDDKYSVLKHLTYQYQYYSSSYVKAIKRDFLIENELFFKSGILSEDIGWSGEILIKAQHFAVLGSGFYSYILRDSGSITSSVGRKNILDILTQIERAIEMIPAEESDPKLQALYYEYWAYQFAAFLGDVPTLSGDEDYNDILDRCRRCTFLLNYDHVPKVKAVKLSYRILGLKNTMRLLHRYLERNWR